MKSYLLDNRVRFIPSTSSLYRVEAEGQINVVNLNGPAGRCLHLLLSNKTLTSQQELYAFAWDDQGAQITPNNLYQNMSLIRKALANIFDSDGEYIITVPRQGFYINPTITIQEQDIESEESVAALARQANNKYRPSIKTYCYSILVLVLIAIITGDVLYDYNYSDSGIFFSAYHEIANNHGCKFYVNAELDNPARRKEIIDTMQWACIRGKHNYITGYDFSSPYSVLSCTQQMTDSASAQCSSLLIMDKNTQ